MHNDRILPDGPMLVLPVQGRGTVVLNVSRQHPRRRPATATPSASAAPSSAPAASPPDDDASNLGSGPHPTVTLVSSGAAPRRVLRYRIKNGQHESLAILMSLAMQMDINGHAMPNVPVPAMRAVMSLQTTRADAAGFAYTFSIDSFDVQSTPCLPYHPGRASSSTTIARQG